MCSELLSSKNYKSPKRTKAKKDCLTPPPSSFGRLKNKVLVMEPWQGISLISILLFLLLFFLLLQKVESYPEDLLYIFPS